MSQDLTAKQPLRRRPAVLHGVIAAVLGLVAFGFRLLATRDFTNDHFMHMAWSQQLLLGDLPGRDFVEPGMPLTVLLSAVAQYVLPGPFSETILSCLMLAIAASAVYLVGVRLTGSVAAGLGAALAAVAFMPRFYGYPKVLVPAVAVLTLQMYLARPSRSRLVVMGLWIAAAFLFRHDLGLYAGLPLVIALVVAHRPDWKRGVRAAAECGGATALALGPYAVFTAWSEGLLEHVRTAIEFTKGEVHQRLDTWPELPAWGSAWTGVWSGGDSATLLYYLAYLLVPISALLTIVRWGDARREPAAVAAALTGVLGFYLVIVLRHPLDARIQDLAGVLPLVAAWVAAEGVRVALLLMSRRTIAAGVAGAALALVLVATTAGAATSVWVLGRVGEQLQETRAHDGWRKMQEVAIGIKDGGTVWPWERFWPNTGPPPPAIAYLHECTAASDRVYLTWSAPEYYFFSRRGFGGGQALFVARGFNTSRDEDLLLARLGGERVPVVLVNETQRREFATVYPRVDRWLQTRYRTVDRFRLYNDDEISVGVTRDRTPSRAHDATGWPCGFDTEQTLTRP
jgi:hypothetical protein